MKEIILYVAVLMLSFSINAQTSTIENDPLFDQYAKAYKTSSQSGNGKNYETAFINFYNKFNSNKEYTKFEKSNNKERWLEKNFSKIKFQTSAEALNAYQEIERLKSLLEKDSNEVIALYNELLKKYDREVIYSTVKAKVWSEL